MTALEFFVAGVPIPQGSKTERTHKGRTWSYEQNANKLKPWRETVGFVARSHAHWTMFPLKGAVRLDVNFVMPRPKAMGKRPSTPDDAAKKPDRDKLLRAVQDALSGVLYLDDCQVTCGEPTKRVAEYGEEPGARIRVQSAQGEER